MITIDILQIILLLVLPVWLIYYKVIPFRYRVHTLGLASLAVLFIMILEGWRLRKIGLRFDNIRESLLIYILFTLIAAVGVIIASQILKAKPKKFFWKEKHFIYGFLILSLLQEFLFRSFLISKLDAIFNFDILIILVNAFLFALIHIVYFNNKMTWLIIFIGGLGFASLYLYYPNLILITISHSILNYFAVLFGFYSQERGI